MSNAQVIAKWNAEATTRTHNAALSVCSPLSSARLKNLFASADVADAIEFYVEDTEAELFTFAKEGDDLAAWALLIRLLPWFDRYSRQNGSLNVVVDDDDVFQMIAEAFFGRMESEDSIEVFRSAFLSDARHTLREAQRFTTAFTAPSQEMTYVRRLIREFDGDVEAAFEAASLQNDANHRMSRDRFFSLAGVLDPRQEVRLDVEPGEGQRSAMDTLDDPSAARAFAAVLGATFESEDIEDAWAGLTDREREIVDRRLGLTSGQSETAVEVAANLGVTKQAVSKSYTNAIHKIRGAISPRRNETRERAAQPRKARKVESVPAPSFPVTTRVIADEVPVLTVADRRANPRDGVRSPLYIRVGDQWATVYARPIPERVAFSTFRSSTEHPLAS